MLGNMEYDGGFERFSFFFNSVHFIAAKIPADLFFKNKKKSLDVKNASRNFGRKIWNFFKFRNFF